MFSNLSKKYNISESNLEKIYSEYLSLIVDKSKEYVEELKTLPSKSMKELYYDKSGKYCFYLRYLGKFYLPYIKYIKVIKNGNK